jgi:DNA repair exonuclease SbcCD ATPase subunit
MSEEKLRAAMAENATLRQEVERKDASIIGWMNMVDALRRQVEEQAAKLRRLADHTPDAHSGQCAILKAADPARPCGCGVLDDLFPLEVLRRAEQAESSLAAAQERIKELSNLSPFIKQIQRVEAERDAALSRAEALAQVVQAVKDRTEERIKEVGSHPHLRMLLDITTRALAAPSEPKEGA